MIRVAVIYKQRLVAAMFSRFVASEKGMLAVGEAWDGRGAVRLCRDKRPDVMLVGSAVLGAVTVAESREVRQLYEAALLIIGGRGGDTPVFGEDGSRVRDHYLPEDCGPEELATTIRVAARGVRKPDGEDDASGRGEEKIWWPPPRMAKLTPRESEILQAVAHGASSGQIARELHLSERTVRNHLQNVYGKLGVNGRARAIIYAARHGLVDYRAAVEDR